MEDKDYKTPARGEFGSRDEIDLASVALTLWRRKWLIIVVVVVFVIGSIAYALLKQPLYAAVATVIPVSNSGMSSALSQYAALASSFGVSVPSISGGASAPDQEILAILQSRTLCEYLVKDLKLEPLIVKHPGRLKGQNPFQVAVHRLQTQNLSVSEDPKSSVISIKVTFPEKKTAEQIANHAVKVLENILNQKNASLTTQSSKSLEQQVAEQAKKVQQLQKEMAAFQKNTKIISAQGQVSSAMTLYGDLLQQKLSLEVALSRLQNSLSSDNPQVAAARAQLDAVNAQIAKLEGTTGVGSFSMGNAPDQIVQYQSIAGELDVATKIYASLLGAYENEKLQQAQNQVFVQVIDPAVAPELPSQPKKKLVVIIGALLGVIVGLLSAFIAQGTSRLLSEVRLQVSRENQSN